MLTSKNMYTTIFLRFISFKKKWKAFEKNIPSYCRCKFRKRSLSLTVSYPFRFFFA